MDFRNTAIIADYFIARKEVAVSENEYLKVMGVKVLLEMDKLKLEVEKLMKE